ncbi:MAG: CHAT domain-containing protein [Pyrinomonadaceae bacterium]
MNNSPEDQDSIRKHLLGNLTDKVKMRRIEEKILLDDQFVEDLSVTEDELMDEYLDDTLTASEREQFLQFFLISPERKEKLRLIRNLREIAAKAETARSVEKFSKKKTVFFDWQGLFSPASLRFAVFALIVGGLGFGVWRIAFYQSDVEKGLAELRLAYRGERPVEARTTANFDYAPLLNTRGGMKPALEETARRRAENFLLNATENSTDAKARQALGLLFLTEKKFDEALIQFNLALKSAPGDATLHNDLGAVLLEKAKQAETEERFDESMENKALSLQAINRALEIDPVMTEALFNKALVLQKMPAPEQARTAWNKYLEKDSASPWADEARKNLELLRRQTGISEKDKSQIWQDFLSAYRRQDDALAWKIASQTKELITGVMVQQQLTQSFLEASQQSQKEEANEILSAFVYLGELEKQNAGDSYFAELAGFYRNSNQTQQQKLREAHAEMQKGYELLFARNWKSAIETFQRAKRGFSEADNYWEATIAEYQIGYSLCQIKKIKESNERLLALSDFARRKHYRWLQVLVDGWLGSNYSLLGEHSKAIFYNQKSLKTAEEISDTYNIQKALTQLAHEYWLIGDSRKTLFNIYRSLDSSNLYFLSSRQKSRNLLFATESLYRFKFYDAAAAFAAEEFYVAQNETKDKWLSHTARNHLALIYGKAEKYQVALGEIEASFRLANSFEEEAMRQTQIAKTRLILAHLQREAGECEKAIINYNQVIKDYEQTDFSINKYEARKGRFLCFIAQKDDLTIKEETPALLRMFDQNRRTIAEESNRNIFFDNEQSIYDLVTDHAYTRLKDAEQAFNYAENSRARSLLDVIENNPSQPFLLPEIRQKIPPGVQIVYYAVLADKVLIWQISDTKFIALDVPLDSAALAAKIQNHTKFLTEKSDSRQAAKELYRILLAPVAETLEPDKSLCIIPDKTLFSVPFAALVSPQTNKYLIEDYALFLAPSATVFLKLTETARRKSGTQTETVLSIGNPSFSRREYPELANLPGASREAEEIAALYNSAKAFVGREAVKEQVVNNLNKADVLHFAGHYVANAKSPSLSKMLLASSDLSVEEIAQMKLPRARLMILSACETGVEKFYNGEGMIGAARSFLAADVPLVVASQWMVDSEATAELMTEFHRLRKEQGLTTIAALRQAQINMLAAENMQFREPFYWAAFLPIGGYAEY